MDTAEQSKQLSVRSRAVSPRFWSAAAGALICLLSASSVKAQEIWHHREDPTPPFVGDASQPGYAITDSQGNVIVSGQLPHASGNNGVVAKYAPDGTKLWVHGQPGTIVRLDNAKPVGALAEDNADNIYSVSSLPAQSLGTTIQFVKYAPDGTKLLSTQFQVSPIALSVDGLLVDRTTEESYIYGEATRLTSGGQAVVDAYVTKIDEDGHQLWISTLPGSSSEENTFKSGVLDSQGQIVLANVNQSFSGQADTLSIDIVKYDASGKLLYKSQLSKPAVVSDDDISSNMLIDSSDSVYIGGSSSLDFDSMLIAKFSSDGTEMWKRQYNDDGNIGSGLVSCLAFDSTGDVIAAGGTESRNNSEYGATFLKYTPEGSKVWARTDERIDDPEFSIVGLATMGSGGGFYAEEHLFGFSTSTFSFVNSAATCKFDVDGHKVKEKDYAGSLEYPGTFVPTALAYDPISDSVFMTGYGVYLTFPSPDPPYVPSWETIKYQFGQ